MYKELILWEVKYNIIKGWSKNHALKLIICLTFALGLLLEVCEWDLHLGCIILTIPQMMAKIWDKQDYSIAF